MVEIINIVFPSFPFKLRIILALWFFENKIEILRTKCNIMLPAVRKHRAEEQKEKVYSVLKYNGVQMKLAKPSFFIKIRTELHIDKVLRYVVKVKVHIAKLTFCCFHMNMTVKVSENPPGRSYYGFYSGLTLLGDSCTLWCVKTIHWGTIRPQSITASSAASKKTATIFLTDGGLTSNITLLCI